MCWQVAGAGQGELERNQSEYISVISTHGGATDS